MTTAIEKRQQQAVMQRMATDPAFCRQQTIIEASGKPVLYRDVAEPWQEQGFTAMDAAWLYSIGLSPSYDGPMRNWRELCRGAAKTWGLAWRASWALQFAPRRIRINWYAADTDQARLGIRSIQTHCELNRWQTLEIQKNVVRNPATGSELSVMSSDAASGYGELCDAIVIDEIGNWADTESSQRLWEMIISTATKRDNCVVENSTNSGYVDSFSWKIREAVREDAENWCFQSVSDIPRWITERKLAEQRRLLPPHVYRRLWENAWVAGGDSGLDPSDIRACMVLSCPPPYSPHHVHVMGVDIGLKRDRAAITVWAADPHSGMVNLSACRSFSPKEHGGEVSLDVVQNAAVTLCHAYNVALVLIDPWNAASIRQSMQAMGINIRERHFVPKNLTIMATSALDACRTRSLRLYNDEELLNGLMRMQIKETSYGFCLVAARTKEGHFDKAFSAVIALPEALWAARNFTSEQLNRPMIQRIIT